jgi:K+-transporting ATPase c subunit
MEGARGVDWPVMRNLVEQKIEDRMFGVPGKPRFNVL